MPRTRFPLQPGPPCLDLANTLVSERPGRDLLTTEAQLADWLDAQGIAVPGQEEAPAALEELRVLRATVRELVLATINGTDLRPETVNRLNAFAARAARAPQLVLTAAGPRHTEHAPGAPVDRLLSDLACCTIELVAGTERDRLRACANPKCRLLFVAGHPRRTWCDSRTCGNRARVARHRTNVR